MTDKPSIRDFIKNGVQGLHDLQAEQRDEIQATAESMTELDNEAYKARITGVFEESAKKRMGGDLAEKGAVLLGVFLDAVL